MPTSYLILDNEQRRRLDMNGSHATRIAWRKKRGTPDSQASLE